MEIIQLGFFMLVKVMLHLNLFSAGMGKVENEMHSRFYHNRFYYLSDTLTLRGITLLWNWTQNLSQCCEILQRKLSDSLVQEIA